MDETEGLPPVGSQRAPVCQRGIEHDVGADDVGLDEGAWAVDRAVDMALGGKMDDRVRCERRKGRRHCPPIADVGLKQAVALVRGHLFQRVGARGIGQFVEVEDLMSLLAHQHPHEGGADEARAAGDQ